MKVKRSKSAGEVLIEVNRRDESLLKAAAATPFRLKNILVPIDFSNCSEKALQYALPLVEQHQANLTLLYVVALQPFPGGEYGILDLSSVEGEIKENAKRRLAEWSGRLEAKVNVDYIVRSGSAATEIVGAAKSIPADLIVISTHGYSGFKHFVLGSVAEHVVRHAPCPVLVVREVEHEFLAP